MTTVGASPTQPLNTTERDRHLWMADHHAKQADLFRRVGNDDMARQADDASRKARERAEN